MKKFVTRFLAVTMIVLGACMLHTAGNTVLAAETTTENTSTKAIYIPVDNVQEYRSESGYTYPKPAGTEAEGKEDWVFAGWYYQGSNSNYVAYSEAGMSNVASAYAKYVPAEVLSTKFQVSAGTSEGSEKASLRVVTSIDSRSYQKVGFELKSGRTGVTKNVESTTVFKRIRTATEGLDYGYSPIIFDTAAEYFMTVTIANIKNANFIRLHIPPYGKLTPELIDQTLEETKKFAAEHYSDYNYKAFACNSWLVDPQLDELLDEESAMLCGFPYFCENSKTNHIIMCSLQL